MFRVWPRMLCACAFALVAIAASAQQPIPGFDTAVAGRQQRIGDNHYILLTNVELKLKGGETEIYAERAEMWSDENRVVATGNVVYVQGTNRIAADRAEFNTQTKLGTFYNATGIALVKPQPPRPQAPGGIAVPPPSNVDTDVYFYGEKIEKIGPKKYRITKGGFTTCVQPTPRWMLTSKTVVLNLDHYTLLRDAVFSVKGVPMLYTPVLYYPTKKEDRATGFLIPTYGSSSVRGQSIHNAFFWAMDRSQDATFLHDWFSNTGQGLGSEYRYNFGAASNGNLNAYMLDEHQATYANADGSTGTLPASRSFEIRGSANQMLPLGLRARARADYFSDLQTMQTFNTNVNDFLRNQRNFGGNVVGAWGTYTLNATLDHTEYFYSATNSAVSGSWPRVSIARNERPIGDTPLYFSVGGEYATLLRESKQPDADVDMGTTRFDFSPQIRFPFKKWQWFTVNSTVGWRDTYYTRSLDANGNPTDQGLNRRVYTMQAQILGPAFNRVWDTPDNGYAEKFKHSVEPFLNLSRVSSVDNFSQIIRIDGTDTLIGSTQYSYGVTNRFYAKRHVGATSQAQEIITVQLSQTYYTNETAAQLDPRYQTSFTSDPTAAPSHFSPISLSVRAMPTAALTATVNADFDSRYHSLRTISANGSYSWTGRVLTTVGWSKRAFIPELAGFNNPDFLDQSINANTNVHTKDNRFGGIYQINYDVLHSKVLQQRMNGFYNAQCCGIAFEYQRFNYGGIISSYGIPADHRFFLSFTLAGLGNFSPFNGAMSGVPR